MNIKLTSRFRELTLLLQIYAYGILFNGIKH